MSTLTMGLNATTIQSLRKLLYIASTIPALVTLIAGTLATQTEQLLFVVVTSSFVWFSMFASFLLLYFLETGTNHSKFFIVCIYHFMCIGAVVTFLKSLSNNGGNVLFFWTPISFQLGIFIAVGLQECAAVVSWRRTRGFLLSFLNGLRLLFGAEDERLPI
ncbi:hypothetical protein BJ166DRAFT_529653 [Pestalotiopsis sp. NC0098]|nr:hypothetical protein BJ166DRAFT_529653 [Pestalotiopsis sp. NC0098]